MDTGKVQVLLGGSPVAKHGSLRAGRSDGQLERCVKVVLLFVWAVDHLPAPDHQETRVSQVGCVQLVTLPVQHHNAGGAATCRHNRTQIHFFRIYKPKCWPALRPLLKRDENKLYWLQVRSVQTVALEMIFDRPSDRKSRLVKWGKKIENDETVWSVFAHFGSSRIHKK